MMDVKSVQDNPEKLYDLNKRILEIKKKIQLSGNIIETSYSRHRLLACLLKNFYISI